MANIAIISSSVRDGRNSDRVALYLKKYVETLGHQAEILDLKEYNFPLFSERLMYQKEPSAALMDFTERFKKADALIIVTPVYNGSYAAALKNIIDVYWAEWRRKVCLVYAVSDGPVPPIAAVQQVQTILLKMGALVTPVLGTVINVSASFAPDGTPADAASMEKLCKGPVGEMLWLMSKTAQ